jgi:hypothetical protein
LAYRAYLCRIGCMAECRHHQTCVVGAFGGIDADHPHPVKGGRELHYAFDYDTGLMHEWAGRAGRCRVYRPEVDDDDPGEEPEALEQP